MNLDPSGTRWRVITLTNGGKPSQCWRYDEPEAPGLYALAGLDGEPPRAGAPVNVAVFDDAWLDRTQPNLLIAERFANETELRDWYARNVGHSADGSSLPELLELVAGSMIFALRDAQPMSGGDGA